MKLLVTGANGWLGKSIVDFISRGSLVQSELGYCDWVFTHLPGEDTRDLLKLSEGLSREVCPLDITSIDTVRQLFSKGDIQYVLHTAGVIHPKRVVDFYRINTEGTANLVKSAKEAGVQKSIILSSNSPFGFNRDKNLLFNESSPYNPYMNYGRSKFLMEEKVRELSQDKRMETVLIRAPWFYGPFQPDRQTLFFKMIQEGRFPTLGSGENLRSMVFTENLSEGIFRALLKKGHYGEAFWIADRRPYSMNEIIETVKAVLKREFRRRVSDRRVFLPGFTSLVAEKVDGFLQGIGLYHQKIHVLSEMSRSIACSVTKAQRELGYEAPVELYEGMKRSIQYCVDRRTL